jgi:ribosomal protein L17
MNDYVSMLRDANKKIVALEAKHERVKKYNSSLLAKLKYYISEEEAEIRDLEQQAKGVRDFVEPYVTCGNSAYKHGLRRVIDLQNQAKELKEQGSD